MTQDCAAWMEVLQRGLVYIRAACQAGDTSRAEAIADALHNIPAIVAGRDHYTLDDALNLFLLPLVKRYPDLQPLLDALNS